MVAKKYQMFLPPLAENTQTGLITLLAGVEAGMVVEEEGIIGTASTIGGHASFLGPRSNSFEGLIEELNAFRTEFGAPPRAAYGLSALITGAPEGNPASDPNPSLSAGRMSVLGPRSSAFSALKSELAAGLESNLQALLLGETEPVLPSEVQHVAPVPTGIGEDEIVPGVSAAANLSESQNQLVAAQGGISGGAGAPERQTMLLAEDSNTELERLVIAKLEEEVQSKINQVKGAIQRPIIDEIKFATAQALKMEITQLNAIISDTKLTASIIKTIARMSSVFL